MAAARSRAIAPDRPAAYSVAHGRGGFWSAVGALCAVVVTACVAGRWVGHMCVMCSRRVAVRMLAWPLGRAPAHLTELPEIKAPISYFFRS